MPVIVKKPLMDGDFITISVGEFISLLQKYPTDMPVVARGGGCFLFAITTPFVGVVDEQLQMYGTYDV